ncbi:unnamed protein product [marine sediment metagenome]|uniref:Uncharacterized protein n=1 Tax=marine sediment metagenome TaxID=412755 RepID=X1QIW5_9ZZZZ
MKKVLFSLPSESLATKWASSFVKRYVVWKNLLIDRQYLGGVLARRSLFKFRAPRSDVVIGVGHGSENELMGHGELIWKTGAYEGNEVKGKKIKLLACLTAKSLGEDLIEQGAVSFQGYSEDFVAFLDVMTFLYPFKDRVATPFFMPPCESMNALVKGKSNEEAYQIEYDMFMKNAKAVESEDPEMSFLLKHNAEALVHLEAPK